MVKTFGDFKFDTRRSRLTRAGHPVRLSGQALELLALFVDRPGELISREEIRLKLWPESHVEFDHSLDVVMSRLRAILGEDRSNPRYIETVPRKGYRFVEFVSVKTETPLPAAGFRWARRAGPYAVFALLAVIVALLVARSHYDQFVPRHSRSAEKAHTK